MSARIQTLDWLNGEIDRLQASIQRLAASESAAISREICASSDAQAFEQQIADHEATIARLLARVEELVKERDEVCPTCANGTVYEQLVSANGQIADLTAKLATSEVALERERASAKRKVEKFFDIATLNAAERNAAVAALREAREAWLPYRVTREIERRYELSDRSRAVITAVHAIDYLHRMRDEHGMIERIQAVSILRDGINNALDGRSTGREWMTIRHTYNNERDGPHPPNPAEEDRRCAQCGAINVEPFTHCWQHRPEPIRALSPTPAPQPDYCETDDVAKRLRAEDAQPVEEGMVCSICLDPATYHPDEGVWRHRNKGSQGGQFLCGRYGYPIQVTVEEGREGR